LSTPLYSGRMSCHLTVTYKDPNFNMDYYLTKHMPLAHKQWKKHGMTGYKVLRGEGEEGYDVLAILYFDSVDAAKRGVADEEATGPIMNDVEKYTKTKPNIVIAEVVGSS